MASMASRRERGINVDALAAGGARAVVLAPAYQACAGVVMGSRQVFTPWPRRPRAPMSRR